MDKTPSEFTVSFPWSIELDHCRKLDVGCTPHPTSIDYRVFMYVHCTFHCYPYMVYLPFSFTVPLRRQALEVRTRVKTLQTKFLNITKRTTARIQEKGMDAHEFRLQFVMQMDISEQSQHRQFIETYLMELKPTTTIDDLLCRLSLYWNFLNYNLLQHLVNMFGDEQLKHDMEDYVEALKVFRANTMLCDFIDNWPLRGQKPPEADLRELVIKMVMDKKWEECTLEDVETIEETLTHKFLLPDFVLHLREAEKGCVCLTWYIPAPIAKTLQEDLRNVETEFFKTHGIERVTIDGAECFLTPVKRFARYLKGVYTSEKPLPTVESSLPADKPLPFSLAKIERKKVNPSEADKFTRSSIRGDIDDVVWQKKPMNIDEVGVLPDGSQPKLVLIEGAPGIGKTTFSWESCKKWSKGEILQDHSLLLLLPLRDNNLREAKTLSDLFYHPNQELQQAVVQEVTSNQGKGVAIWLEAWDELDHKPREKASVFLDLIHGRILPLATVFVTSRPWASEHLREKCGHRISQHIEILASAKDQIEYYISKAEAEAQPSSFATKFTDYISCNPAIRAAMYTPVTAKMSAEVFTWSQLTESPPPTTMTELFTTFTLKTLVGYLSTHPLYRKQQLKVTSFSDLPPDVYKQFLGLCRMAYEGILNRQQLVFSASHLPAGFSPLGLMQEVPQVYTQGKASSYHFTHLTLQEFLSAVHISQLPTDEQTKLIQDHLDSGHFKMTLRFVAGLTKLANIPPEITRKLRKDDDNNLTLLHWLFECKDTSVTTRTLGSDEIVVKSHHSWTHYSWTPLDYYVTGHAISRSSCPWRLFVRYSSVDDDKFELFCQGCATPGGTGCEGYISYAIFTNDDITSKHMQLFVSIPPHILHGMRKLDLSGNKLDGKACDLLAKVVPSMSRLEELWLGHNPIGSGGAVEVIKSLCGSGVKKQLWLHDTGIGGPDCEALSELLQSTHSLEQLDIDQNNLSSESVASIITGLSHNNSLTVLAISDSHFSTANTLHLSSLLRDSKCTLTSLWLRDCHISSEGAVELATALCKNTTLRTLTLSGNPIGEHVEGVAAVATMLVENKSLTHLWLEDCHISGQGAGELAAALCKNSTLQGLVLDRNPIGVEGASSMSDMLQHNTSLTWLWLSDNSVGEEGVHQLMNSVKYNQTLWELKLSEKYKSETSDYRINWRR